MTSALSDYEVAIVGGGPSGLTAAILIAEAGFKTALIAPIAPPDRRTTAVLGGSVTLLDRLGITEAVAGVGASMHTMRLIDDTGRLIRAPEVNFRAQEIGREIFGYNIHNADLTRILTERADRCASLTRIDAFVEGATPGDDTIRLALSTGEEVTAKLGVAADGAKSRLREAAGISVKTWSYPQSALVFDVAHARPHGGVSVEFHGPAGPFVFVPLPGNTSSIVLVETPETVEALAALDDIALGLEVERRSHSILGKITVKTPRQAFPLNGATARVFGRARVALVGEAGHRFPPIGAQGLNLSFRDVGTLVERLIDAKRQRQDLGSEGVLAGYDRARRIDVTTRTIGVDIMDRALLADNLPTQALRSVGLMLAGTVPPLRQFMMREGLAPTIGTPRLMRTSGR